MGGHCLKICLLVFLAFFFGKPINAQNFESSFDSIMVQSSKDKKLEFSLNHSQLKEVSFYSYHPRHATIKANNVLSGVGKGILTLFSGVGLEDNKDNVDLEMNIKIKSNDSKTSWDLHLYCKGYTEKDISRTRSDEGGYSLSVDHYAHVDWNQGITAELFKKKSKIGEFVLIKYTANSDASLKGPIEFLEEMKAKNVQENNFESKTSYRQSGNDFAVIGQLFGTDFKIVTNMSLQKYWVFQDDTIKAMLQFSHKNSNTFVKNYVLLSNPDMSSVESAYWIKMALMAKHLNNTIEKSNYSW
ncbi:hypothetical protein [Lutimonas sp.]|uniref:hypothetical protein n=1 Tax=Lutimonas sp. TaxID=1872403 RepID=UPI003D9AEF47